MCHMSGLASQGYARSPGSCIFRAASRAPLRDVQSFFPPWVSQVPMFPAPQPEACSGVGFLIFRPTGLPSPPTVSQLPIAVCPLGLD